VNKQKMTNIYQLFKVRGGTPFILIWVLILAVLLTFPIIGYLSGELLGYIAFSVFPVAILLNISIIIAHTVQKGAVQISKTGWLILCITVLVFVSVVSCLQYPNANEGAGIIIVSSMGILSFPLCFFVVCIYAGFIYLFDYLELTIIPDLGLMNMLVDNFILWLCFFVASYLQWFKLYPFLMQKWQKKKLKSKKAINLEIVEDT
jgi:hypothetical protein